MQLLHVTVSNPPRFPTVTKNDYNHRLGVNEARTVLILRFITSPSIRIIRVSLLIVQTFLVQTLTRAKRVYHLRTLLQSGQR